MFNIKKSFLLLCGVAFFLPFVCIAQEEEAETSPIQFNGVIETEASMLIAQGDETTTESEFGLATVELGADGKLSDNVEAHLLLLYEEGENDDNIAVDEATITLKNIYGIPLAITSGRLYVPFGEFNSHFVSDPFTLEMAETGKTALQIGIEHEFLAASLALFKSGVAAIDEEGNHINNFAARIAVTPTEEMLGEGISLSAGASLIKNLADTDGIGNVIGVDLEADKLNDIPLGLGAFFSAGIPDAFLDGEIITALSDFSGKAAGREFESKPWAMNIELGYALSQSPIPVEIAAKFEMLHQGRDADVKRFGGLVGTSLFGETANIGIEFLRTDAGEKLDPENTLTFQLAAEF